VARDVSDASVPRASCWLAGGRLWDFEVQSEIQRGGGLLPFEDGIRLLTQCVTIYPCRGVGSWLTPDLYQAEHQGISLWAGPTSMIA
jgi:hypothetical protein